MLSNALSRLSWLSGLAAVPAATLSAAQTAGSASAPDVTGIPIGLYGLLAAGLVADVALLAWFVRRIKVRPANPFGLSRAPGRTNSLHPLHLMGLLTVWLVAPMVTFQVLSELWAVPQAKALLLGGLIGQALLLAGCLLLGAHAFRLGIQRGLGLTVRRYILDTLKGLIAYIAILPVCVVLLVLTAAILPKQIIREHPLLAAMSEMGPWWQALSAFSAVVMAPLGEELFFRGMIQSFLRRCLLGPGAVIVITSAFFAAMHYQVPQSVPAMFVLALALGYNYERTGRLLPSIVLHAAFNAVFTAMRIFQSS